ncbi:hypothetical protein EN746_19875 [Mesorhizobium sp. M8A.F.Ca.ET.023.02.2.1]|nr:hypothetical protein EN746_19875 [Mesorhizobium sp. M8A.F.Ca.ET.023.02.2.1]
MGFSSRLLATFPGAGAAPHLPAGILSPYSDGEGDAPLPRRFSATLAVGETIGEQPFLPVAIRGEMPGRAMRGGGNLRWTFTSFET